MKRGNAHFAASGLSPDGSIEERAGCGARPEEEMRKVKPVRAMPLRWGGSSRTLNRYDWDRFHNGAGKKMGAPTGGT